MPVAQVANLEVPDYAAPSGFATSIYLVILSEAKDLCNSPAAPRSKRVAQIIPFAGDDKTTDP